MLSPRYLAFAACAFLAACVSSDNGRVSQQPPTPPVAAETVQTEIRQQPVVDPSRDRANPALVADIHEIWRTFPGRTGISIRRIDGNWTISERGDELFPQQSVSKLWVSLTVLDQVDKGRLRLSDSVTIGRNDLAVFHQPIRDRVLAAGVLNETVLSLIQLAITKSDNTANDSLLRTAGGPDAVRSFIESRNLGAIRFGPGERLLQSGIAGLDWDQEYAIGRRFYAARAELPYSVRKNALDRYLADPADGAAPNAITAALGKLARGELLSPASTRLILDTLSNTTSGPRRLKGGVPSGWQFLHKTGTGQDLPPVSTGYNDVGIMTAPDGTRYAIAVMLGDTTAPVIERMKMMQSVSRAVARYHGK